ncbi:MAG: glycogen debranching protein [Planctomycetes bacterium GWF2_41_51]|nr:MAG: glycogen debranching protein [Planctomycetes bacterium GWF2_41_51]HBG27058.1 glycogen debranching protein [Phycisphaerales bacterium]
MEKIIRKINIENNTNLNREWLVTNGLGGYASGTLCCIPTRRYHGYLIAALAAPLGRIIMLNNLIEQVCFPADLKTAKSKIVTFAGSQLEDEQLSENRTYLTEFRLENGLPVWKYTIEDCILEKTLLMPHLQNTIYIIYRLLSQTPIQLLLRPSVEFRPHGKPFTRERKKEYTFSAKSNQFEIYLNSIFPSLKITVDAEKYSFTLDNIQYELNYTYESQAGYDSVSSLWSPGFFCLNLNPGSSTCIIASSESWDLIRTLSSKEAIDAEHIRRTHLIENAMIKSDFSTELVLAADQYIIIPAGRTADVIRANALGDEIRTVIAGYHWFTDWGRDTMISLEGLTHITGRTTEARWILRTFADYVKNGLIPNMFPEQRKQGIYQTADATLWFFHALDRYLTNVKDKLILRMLLPKLIDIIEAHFKGTLFGIAVDLEDGLLSQGQQGYHLTWMDAKCGDWIVTPRRGKAVEINALWYNALCVIIKFLKKEQPENKNLNKYSEYAAKARESFNEKFWFEQGGYLYDIIDGENGNDSALRPNQIFAISLPHEILDKKYWQQVLNTVQTKLLTPFGLRSLSSDHPDYKAKYFGDLRSRDAAYHQGTVWSWLIGPYIDAWLKIYPEEKSKARHFLKSFEDHLNEACIGTVSEIFDAEKPFTARGCISQAWSVAEILRCLYKTME